MELIKTADGKMVTEELLDKWCDALDHDEWPKGWNNVGKVAAPQVEQRPRAATAKPVARLAQVGSTPYLSGNSDVS